MRIELPFPDSRLLPNRKAHWAVKQQATKADRTIAFIEGRNFIARCVMAHQTWRPLKSCQAVVTFYPPDKRKRDLDNLLRALKPSWDGMADAGVLVDDSCIKEISVRLAEPDKSNPRTVIDLEAV